VSSVSSFILKDASPVELIGAIRVVATGEALLSPSVTRRVVALFGRQVGVGLGAVPGLERLTEREREIAAALFLSPRHRTHPCQPGDGASCTRVTAPNSSSSRCGRV